MRWCSFAAGFLACYILTGVTYTTAAFNVPATTTAGAVYYGALWLPIQWLPSRFVAHHLIPSWAFDFDKEPTNDSQRSNDQGPRHPHALRR